MQFDRKNLFLGSLFLVMNLVDSATTVYLLKHGHHEANPLMRFFTDDGYKAFVMWKTIFSWSITAILLLLKRYQVQVRRIFYGINVGFSAVVLYQLAASVRTFF